MRPVDGGPTDGTTAAERPDVSVVIVTWKVRDLADRCLETLYAGTSGVRLEVIVVDNASGDGTLERIAERHPGTIRIDAGHNLGFAGGNNLGFARATGRTVLLLNPDTEVADGAVARLLSVLDGHADVGIAGPKVLLPSGRIQLPCARRFPGLWNQTLEILGVSQKYPRSRFAGRYRMGDWDHLDERDVDAVSGCCLLIRGDLLDRLGGLDESYFMYGEDLDLCWRVRRAGFRVRYAPGAEILHLSEQSSGQNASAMFVETFESMYRFFRKNRGLPTALLYRLIQGGVSAAWWVIETARAALVGGEKARALRTGAIPGYRAIVSWSLHGPSRRARP